MKKRGSGKKSKLKEFKKDIIGYFSETTVHGFRYVVEGRNICERVAWSLMIVMGFAFCARVIYDSSQHWYLDPVQTTLDEVSIPVHQLPFPAITVCDTDSLQMPRRNQWMFVENLFNKFRIRNMSEIAEDIFPGTMQLYVYKPCIRFWKMNGMYL